MKIAILGGGFDPVHWGHVQLLEKTDAVFQFDKIFVVPSKRPPHKPPFLASDSKRVEMLELAFETSSLKAKTEISKFELDSDQISYSIFTISHFSKLYPDAEIFFIIGIDAFYSIPEWHQFPKVLQSCNFIVASRKGIEGKREAIVEELVSEGVVSPLEENTYSTTKSSGKKVYFLNLALPEVSSTQIRLCLQMGAEPLYLVPPKLEQYLKQNKIYTILTEEKKS